MIIMLLVMLVSCKENPVETYTNSLNESYSKSVDTANFATLQSAKRSIKVFYTANQRYPSDIKELSSFMGTTLDEALFQYDPSTGDIKSTKP